jgi:hypothetical protein
MRLGGKTFLSDFGLLLSIFCFPSSRFGVGAFGVVRGSNCSSPVSAFLLSRFSLLTTAIPSCLRGFVVQESVSICG